MVLLHENMHQTENVQCNVTCYIMKVMHMLGTKMIIIINKYQIVGDRMQTGNPEKVAATLTWLETTAEGSLFFLLLLFKPLYQNFI